MPPRKKAAAKRGAVAAAAATATAASPVAVDTKESKSATTASPRWIQLEDKTSKDYRASFVVGWSRWQPYLQRGDAANTNKNVASLYRKKWLEENGHTAIPKQFGVYAIGILPPQTVDMTTTAASLESSMLIVNHGVTGGRANEGSTLNTRLMSYKNKVKAHEWAIGAWLELGFSVYVKWRVVQTTVEVMNKRSSILGAHARKRRETKALKTWMFFLNTSEQADVKGKGASLNQDADAFVVDNSGKRVANYRPKPVDVKAWLCEVLRTAATKTKDQLIADIRSLYDSL